MYEKWLTMSAVYDKLHTGIEQDYIIFLSDKYFITVKKF